MKIHFYFALFLFSILCLGSCIDNNDGYPSNVYFSKEGGCKIIYGEGGFYGLTIDNEINHSCYRPNIDSIYNEFDDSGFEIANSEWMTAIHTLYSDSIVVKVKPNLTGKRRNARILGMDMNSTVEIYVRQDK